MNNKAYLYSEAERFYVYNECTIDETASKLELNPTTELTENLILATRNIADVKLVLANELNTYDVLYVNKIIITEDAVKYVEEVLK